MDDFEGFTKIAQQFDPSKIDIFYTISEIMPAQEQKEELEIQQCYILFNAVHRDPIVIHAIGDVIIGEIENVSTDVEELFFGKVTIDEYGLYLWKGTVEYPPENDEETIITTTSLEKVPFASLDDAQQIPIKEG